jgi:hypothetical protein
VKLYHGTSESVVRKVLKEGLKPRRMSRNKGNWKDTVPSNPSLVYLTVAYAPYFAMCASGDEKWGILEIDTDLLDESSLLPDEDFLEQGTRRQKLPAEWGLNGADMQKRTRFFRDNLHSFQALWTKSIEGLGNAAHHGQIPLEAITRATIFDPSQNKRMMMDAADPLISMLNFAHLGNKYKAQTRWFAGYDVDPREMLTLGLADYSTLPEPMREHFDRLIAQMKADGHLGLERLL